MHLSLKVSTGKGTIHPLMVSLKYGFCCRFLSLGTVPCTRGELQEKSFSEAMSCLAASLTILELHG